MVVRKAKEAYDYFITKNREYGLRVATRVIAEKTRRWIYLVIGKEEEFKKLVEWALTSYFNPPDEAIEAFRNMFSPYFTLPTINQQSSTEKPYNDTSLTNLQSKLQTSYEERSVDLQFSNPTEV